MGQMTGTQPLNEASRPKNSVDTSVCVIIPYYNGSKYIRRSAKSVLEQTVPPDEFVVVNDGSSPEETAELEKIAQEMGFSVLHKENGGQGSARNHGVAHTKSNLISFLDQDDFYLQDHIETLLDAIDHKDPHFGWVYADLIEADEAGNVVRRETVQHHSNHPKKFINDMIRYDMHVLPSASLISREAFLSVDGFDPQFTGYEDDDLFMRIFRRGYSNHFIEKPVTVWCINSNSTSYSIKMSRSRLRYIKKLVTQFPDDPDKCRFFVRDLMLPRFNPLVLGEAMRAVLPSSSPQDQKMAAYKDELIAIMNEYVELMTANSSMSDKAKRRMRAQARVISSGSKFLVKLGRRIRHILRR